MAYGTYLLQRKEDIDFAAQCEAAEEYATQLLHDACWKSAVEGDLEPVYWQGILIGHIRKFSDRLRIEMLRAHMPEKFKIAATANVTVNTQNNTYVLTEERRQELIAKRHRALEAMLGPMTAAPALLESNG